MKYDVLGIGAPFLDHVVQVSEEFLAGLPGGKGGMIPVDYQTYRKLLENCGSLPTVATGGSCANTIKGLAHLGHSCALAGKLGSDQAGRVFLNGLEKLGVASRMIKTETPTGQVICFVTPDSQRTFRSYLGSGSEMGPDDLKPEMFEGVRLVHIEGYTILNPGLTQRAMELAKDANALVSFDLASFELVESFKNPLIRLISEYVDILFANENETESLTRLSPEQGSLILKDLCEIVVVMTGKDGCWVGHADEHIRCPAKSVEPIDTTGAGDLFAAGFLHGYLNGQSLRKCAYYGALTGAEVVQIFGADLTPAVWEKLKGIMP